MEVGTEFFRFAFEMKLIIRKDDRFCQYAQYKVTMIQISNENDNWQ